MRTISVGVARNDYAGLKATMRKRKNKVLINSENLTPIMARILPATLQIKKFEDVFCKYNDPCYPDLLDLPSVVDRTLSYRENLEEVKSAYPMYAWEKGEIPTARSYEKQIIDDLRSQASEFSYDIVKGYKVQDLERKARKLGRTEADLAACKVSKRAPRSTPPGTCPVKNVSVKKHFRCPPRR